jgi:hypothetical protein
VEAKRVVEIVEGLIKECPGKSIGIVTFNVNQQNCIMDQLDARALEAGLTYPEDLFIKNIENVQGDERDIIIFSIAYAPDAKGKMRYHFGSLNVQKGENRLNVAITRARERIIIVSSILPKQLNVDQAKNEGPRLLRKYLEYALDVSKGKFVATIQEDKGHGVDWYLKNKIKKLDFGKDVDFELKEEMPFADLTIKSGDNYLGLVITDDDHYYQSISVKDLHIYRPFTLSSKHWKFTGIFSREYWHDKAAIKERLLRFSNADR